jgi:hypothetical protein
MNCLREFVDRTQVIGRKEDRKTQSRSGYYPSFGQPLQQRWLDFH